MNSDLLQLSGAVGTQAAPHLFGVPTVVNLPAHFPRGVAAHYGSPFREERALRTGGAFTDLSCLDILDISGPDTLSWLSSLSTQDVQNLRPGDSSELLFLDPKGHIEYAAGALASESGLLLLLDPGYGASLADFLLSMRFMKRVEIVERSDLTALGYVFPDDESATHQGYPPQPEPLIWRDPWPHTAQKSATYGPEDARHRACGIRRVIEILAQENLTARAAQLLKEGLTPAGYVAWEALRISLWRPSIKEVIPGHTLPHELDWLRSAVHLSKGCYRGQEAVAKLVNLGRTPRRLTYLYLEGPDDSLPAPGSEITSEGKTVGTLMSVSRTWEEGPVALALLTRSLPASSSLEIGKFLASQEVIVALDGKSSASLHERPGSELRLLGGLRRGERKLL